MATPPAPPRAAPPPAMPHAPPARRWSALPARQPPGLVLRPQAAPAGAALVAPAGVSSDPHVSSCPLDIQSPCLVSGAKKHFLAGSRRSLHRTAASAQWSISVRPIDLAAAKICCRRSAPYYLSRIFQLL